MEEENERLRKENETLKALLLMKNLKATMTDCEDKRTTRFAGSPEDLLAFCRLQERVVEMKSMYMLLRADALVLKGEIEDGMETIKRIIQNWNRTKQ